MPLDSIREIPTLSPTFSVLVTSFITTLESVIELLSTKDKTAWSRTEASFIPKRVQFVNETVTALLSWNQSLCQLMLDIIKPLTSILTEFVIEIPGTLYYHTFWSNISVSNLMLALWLTSIAGMPFSA
jgi:hypothetical protein